MGGSAVTEFYIIQLKSNSSVDGVHEALKSAIAGVKSADGSQKVLFGRQLENPNVGVLSVVWSSYDDAKANHASPATFSAVADSVASHTLNADATAVLEAPTTEIFTGYGAETGFAENVKDFSEKVDAEKPEGYLGAVHGEVLEEISQAPDGPKGKAVKLVIGWTSKDAHIEAKGKPGAIANNIGLLRELRSGGDMFHVQFKEL